MIFKPNDLGRLNRYVSVVNNRMLQIWLNTRRRKTGLLQSSIKLETQIIRKGEIVIRFLARQVPYARYQDEGTITRRQPSADKDNLWKGTGVRGRGVKRNGGITPANFSAPLFKKINGDNILQIIKDVVTKKSMEDFKKQVFRNGNNLNN